MTGVDWRQLGAVLHGRLMGEARAGRPGTGARRAAEKAECCRALEQQAARVREWLLGRESTVHGFACMILRMEADLMAARAEVVAGPTEKRRGWCRGLYRAVSLALGALEAVALRMDVRGSAVKIRPAVVDRVAAFKVERRDAATEAAEAERVFFEEADRVLGQGKMTGGTAAQKRESR